MKIVSITAIKNEADIIESFVRYHSNIMDLMIILDNGSTDDSANILHKLINEGMPIVVITDDDRYFEPLEKYNELLAKAINEFNADIVCPLDCDEFISYDYDNPRKLIEKIPKNSVYMVKWRTYVPTSSDDTNELFIPKRIQNIREENIEKEYKVIMPKEVFVRFNVKVIMGNHGIDVENRFKNKIKKIKIDELKISHFPLRSVNQTMSKVMVNYPNTLSRKEVKKGLSYHYKIMYDTIKQKGTISINDISEFAKQYSLEENMDKTEFEKIIGTTYKPMNLNFCTDTQIKYHFDENPMENVLNNYVYFAEEINKFKVKNIKDYNQIRSLSNQINQLEEKVSNLKNEYIHKKNELLSNNYVHENTLKSYKKENAYLKNNYRNKSKLSTLKEYLYIILNSKRNEIILNLKLYKTMKNSDCFSLRYYLNKYPEIIENKICKNYSAELHYVCHGFEEGKIFNPKCSEFTSKKILLEKLKEI